MKKIAVIHYSPLEYYPPVTNFLNHVTDFNDLTIKVFSTHNIKNRNIYTNNSISEIHRSLLPNPNELSLIRLIKYLYFNLVCFLKLTFFNPDEILYYESLSAAPVYWYLLLFGKRANLSIHYHEYSSTEWYNKGMQIVKLYHIYEKQYLYKKASWISQTNQDRIDLFLKDNPEISKGKMKVVPNYPPKSWQKDEEFSRRRKKSVKTVYVGSLSIENTFVKEYCEWVIKQKGKVLFDIYTYNLHNDTKEYLENLHSKYINFKTEGIEYKLIPSILPNYDVGVIFYKDYSENVRYCAPNKIFEYMACNLEVWCSHKMLGVIPYLSNKNPRVLAVDFLNLDTSELLQEAPSDANNKTEHNLYVAEKALKPLLMNLGIS